MCVLVYEMKIQRERGGGGGGVEERERKKREHSSRPSDQGCGTEGQTT